MAQTIIDNAIIMLISVFIIDISKALPSLNRYIFRCTFGKEIPYNKSYISLLAGLTECSLCFTWWVCLIYNTIMGDVRFIYGVGFAAAFSYTSVIAKLLLNKVLDWFSSRLV